MYTHILVPTDGSPLSLKAARAGAELARKLEARMTAVYVIAPFVSSYVSDGIYLDGPLKKREYNEAMIARAEKALAQVASAALQANVAFDSTTIESRSPWEGIIKAASKLKCDTVVMSSHGRGGIAGIVLGSQTQRVLTHSKIPVLVCR